MNNAQWACTKRSSFAGVAEETLTNYAKSELTLANEWANSNQPNPIPTQAQLDPIRSDRRQMCSVTIACATEIERLSTQRVVLSNRHSSIITRTHTRIALGVLSISPIASCSFHSLYECVHSGTRFTAEQLPPFDRTLRSSQVLATECLQLGNLHCSLPLLPKTALFAVHI